jgi:hypothetical protein
MGIILINRISLCAVTSVTCVFVFSGECHADQWARPRPTTTHSANGGYLFQVTPAEDYLEHPGRCLGELFHRDANRKRVVWSRYLINNVAPVYVLVADSGEHIVTVGAWDEFDRKVPLVIYGTRGKLIHVHTLESLGLENKEDKTGRLTEYPGRAWYWGSLMFFGPEEATLILRLRWGKMLIIDLTHGDLMDDKWYEMHGGWAMSESQWKSLHAFARENAIKVAVAMLDSPDGQRRMAGAVALGQLKYRQGIPKLRGLLTDSHSYVRKQGDEAKEVFFVRKAAKESLEAMGEIVTGVRTEEEQQPPKGREVRGP